MDDVHLVKLANREQEVPHDIHNRENHEVIEWRTWLTSLFLVIGIAGILFGLLANTVWKQEAFSWDAPIMLAIHQIQAPWLDTFMLWISDFGLPSSRLVLVLGVWLWFQKHRRTALTLVFSDLGSVIIVPLAKRVFTRPRPTIITPHEELQDFSFPSGHTLATVTLYGMIAYLCWQNRYYVWALLCAIPLLLIPLSRVYLGAHYPSDILGAITLGIIWMSLVLLTCRVVAMHTQDFKHFNFKIGVLSRLAPKKSSSKTQ